MTEAELDEIEKYAKSDLKDTSDNTYCEDKFCTSHFLANSALELSAALRKSWEQLEIAKNVLREMAQDRISPFQDKSILFIHKSSVALAKIEELEK